MKRIIRSQFYQLRCSVSILRITLLIAAAMAVIGVLVSSTAEGDKTAAGLFIDGDGIFWIFQIMLIGIMTGIICAGDFGEKDLNYELMNGHSRLSIYMARVILCVGLTSLAATILSIVPYLSAALVNGWGDRIRPADVFLRIGLFFLPFMRIAAFFSMLAFIVKKQGAVITLGFVSEMGCIILNDVISNKVGYMLGIFNLTELSNVGDFSLYNVVPGKGVVEYYVCEGEVEPSLAAGTIIVSCVMTIIYLTAGYAFFKHDDID